MTQSQYMVNTLSAVLNSDTDEQKSMKCGLYAVDKKSARLGIDK